MVLRLAHLEDLFGVQVLWELHLYVFIFFI